MRHFSLFDDMDDGFKKKADEVDDYDRGRENMYYTVDLGDEDTVKGFLDLFTWVKRNEKLLRMMPETRGRMPDVMDLEELLDYFVHLDETGDTVLRINGLQLGNLRSLFSVFEIDGQGDDPEEFDEEYPDLFLEDIEKARGSLSGILPERSSRGGLEDIPTMEKNPENLAEGEIPAVVHETCPNCGGSNTFSTVDEFGEVRCDECGALDPRDAEWKNPIAEGPSSVPPATNAGQALAAGNCPKCGSPTTPSVLDPSVLVCSNCGWDGEQLPHLSEQSEEIQGLEQSFNAPSVEHPLGPHTGSEEELEQEFYTSGRFVNLAKWPSNPVWGVEVSPAAGQREPMSGDLATIQQKSKAFNRPVPVTLVEIMGGAWTFKNGHHPA